MSQSEWARKSGYVTWAELSEDDKAELSAWPDFSKPTEAQKKSTMPIFRPSYVKGRRRRGPSIFAGFAL